MPLLFAYGTLREPTVQQATFGRPLDVDLGVEGDVPVAVFAPGGAFLALYRQEGARARPVAVLTG